MRKIEENDIVNDLKYRSQVQYGSCGQEQSRETVVIRRKHSPVATDAQAAGGDYSWCRPSTGTSRPDFGK